jgi:hypothetical protein
MHRPLPWPDARLFIFGEDVNMDYFAPRSFAVASHVVPFIFPVKTQQYRFAHAIAFSGLLD